MRWRTIWELLQETFTEWNKDKAEKMAAALAYYTIVYARRYGSRILPAKYAVPEADLMLSEKQDYRQ